MKKIYIYVAVAVLLIGGGAGVYFMSSSRTKTPGTNTQNSTGTTQASDKKSLKDLLALGTAQNCSYTSEGGSGGNVLIANGKMRGDFTSITDSGQKKTHMIVDGQTSYIWMDDQNAGFKMTFDSSSAAGSDSKVRAEGQMDVNEKVSVDCSPWVVDTSAFSLPSNVRFADFSSFAVPTSGAELNAEQDADMKAQQCAACNSVPAASQAQCKAALGCK